MIGPLLLAVAALALAGWGIAIRYERWGAQWVAIGVFMVALYLGMMLTIAAAAGW